MHENKFKIPFAKLNFAREIFITIFTKIVLEIPPQVQAQIFGQPRRAIVPQKVNFYFMYEWMDDTV